MRHESDPVYRDAACITLRRAETGDIPSLIAIEEQSFATDRMTRRNFRYAILQSKGVVLIALVQGRTAGYGVVAFHAGTGLARLTSFAVAREWRGRGVGRRLLAGLDEAAAARGCRAMRLEVRADNVAAIALYAKAGYRSFGLYTAYYEDDGDALRLSKPLAPP